MSNNRDSHLPRRKLLGLLGIGVTGLTGCLDQLQPEEEQGPESTDEPESTDISDNNSSGNNPSEDSVPIDEEYPEATTGVQRNYAEIIEQEYPEHSDYFREFISDEELDEAFIDAQLEILMEKASDEWQKNILEIEALDQDDWTRTGRHHVDPNGNPGPAYENPFTYQTAPDGFVIGYFNSTGQVHDPRTGEYLGFQPEETLGSGQIIDKRDYGDKVGLKGDKNGDGSIANFLEGVEPEDLNPMEMHTVMAYNKPKIYGGRFPEQETFDIIENVFEEKVPPEVFREVMQNTEHRTNLEEVPPKVNTHFINLGVAPSEDTVDFDDAREIYDDFMPIELRGPVTYHLYTEEIASKWGNGFNFIIEKNEPARKEIGEAGMSSTIYAPNAAESPLQETYWQGVRMHPGDGVEIGEPPQGTPTVTVDNPKHQDFLDREWRALLKGMNVENRSYLQTPIFRNRFDPENYEIEDGN